MPRSLIVWVAVSVTLALGALPGAADSQGMTPAVPLPDDAFQEIVLSSATDPALLEAARLDPAGRSAAYLSADETLVDTGIALGPLPIPMKRPSVTLPAQSPGRVWKTPLYTVRGEATWYDNGTTAMRLPRGTVVVICGQAACVERTITDYGPGIPRRVVDLMPQDFAAVCGCPIWMGITTVTVRIYG